MNDFKKFLDSTSLSEHNKRTLGHLLEFFSEEHVRELVDRSFLFDGEPGVGKTYLAEKLVEHLDVPTLFLGQQKLNIKKLKKFSSLKDLVKNIDEFEEGIVFIDDMNYSLKLDEDGIDLQDDEKKRLMKLIEHVRRTDKKIILVITVGNGGILDDSFIDRIDVKIRFKLPSEENKIGFLEDNFGAYLGKEEVRYVAKNSIGYNYRDLPQMIKIAYREGNKKIDRRSLKKAFLIHNPTGLTRANVNRVVETTFSDVVGNESVKKELRNTITYLKNKKRMDSLGIKRGNLLIFSGAPGTGKTFMASAIAGELEVPLVKVSALDLWGENPLIGIRRATNIAKRFKDCVVFIDDVDKIIGARAFEIGVEGPEIAAFQSDLDDLGEGGGGIATGERCIECPHYLSTGHERPPYRA